MELNKYIISEIFDLKCDDSVSLTNALSILIKKCGLNPKLLMDKNYEPYYVIDVKDLLSIEVDGEDLIAIRNNGWELSKDKKQIVKYINKERKEL